MSGLAGVLYFDGQPNASHMVKKMAERLPDFRADGSGIWDGGNVALYHELSINTPEDRFEKQPVVANDSGLVLSGIFRLDNRGELFDALGIPHSLRSEMPDSQIVLKAYERWRSACLNKFLGDFSFVVWDTHKRVMTLATDFSGSQNIFFHKTDKRLCFASSAAALFAFDDIPRELDEGTFIGRMVGVNGLKGGMGSSFFKAIEGVSGGCYYQIDVKNTKRIRYWDPANTPSTNFAKDQDYYDAFEDLFIKSVDVRLRQDRNIGVLLSGGLDSAAVACVAAKLMAERGEVLRTYTYRPVDGIQATLAPHQIADEWPYVEMIASQHENIEPHYVRVGDGNPLAHSKALLPATESPLFVNVTWLTAIGELAREHNVGAMLNGAAGNLAMSYSSTPRYKVENVLKRGMKLILSTIRSGNTEPLIQAFQKKLGGITKTNLTTMEFLTEQAKADFFHKPSGANKRALEIGDPNLMREKWRRRSENFGSSGNDRFFRAYDMTLPDPTSDRRIIEFCIGTPQHIFSQNGEDRLLVRRGLKAHIPHPVLYRKDRGAQCCDAHVYLQQQKGNYLQLINDFANRNPIARHFDLDLLRAELDSLATHEQPISYTRMVVFWLILMGLDFTQWAETELD